MEIKEFDKFVKKEILPYCFKIMNSKGVSYSGKIDKLANFKRCAKLAEISVEKAWFIYATKHWDAIASYIRGEYNDSEPIKGRILDIINYMFLFAGILKEQERL